MTSFSNQRTNHSRISSYQNYFSDLLNPHDEDIYQLQKRRNSSSTYQNASLHSYDVNNKSILLNNNNNNNNNSISSNIPEYVLTKQEKKRYSQLYNIKDENILDEIIDKRHKQNTSMASQNMDHSFTMNSNASDHSNMHGDANIYKNSYRHTTPTPRSLRHLSTPTHATPSSIPALQLKTPTSYIQTVTNLSPLSYDQDDGSDPGQQINRYFHDFSKFHKDQEFNHSQRKKKIINNTKGLKKTKMNSIFEKLRSISGRDDNDSTTKNNTKHKKQFTSSNIKRNKSKSFKTKNNYIVNRNESFSNNNKSKMVRNYPNFQDPQTLSLIIDYCQNNTMDDDDDDDDDDISHYSRATSKHNNNDNRALTEAVYDTLNNIRESQLYNIKPRYSIRYDKYNKLKKYGSSADLFQNTARKRKIQHFILDQRDNEKIHELWRTYMRTVIADRIKFKLRLEGGEQFFSTDNEDALHSRTNSDMHSLNNKSILLESDNKTGDLNSLQNIINDYISRKRKSSWDDTHLSNSINDLSTDFFNTTHQTTVNHSHKFSQDFFYLS